MPKIFAKYDINRDGAVTKNDIRDASDILEIELREEKADSQRRMAWIAMASMIVFTLGLFSPLVSDTRVQALADLLGLFYIAQAGVVGAYMGVTAWVANNSMKTDRYTTSRSSKISNEPMDDSQRG